MNWPDLECVDGGRGRLGEIKDGSVISGKILVWPSRILQDFPLQNQGESTREGTNFSQTVTEVFSGDEKLQFPWMGDETSLA